MSGWFRVHVLPNSASMSSASIMMWRAVDDLNAGRIPIHEAGLPTDSSLCPSSGPVGCVSPAILKSAVSQAEAIFIARLDARRGDGDDAADLAYVHTGGGRDRHRRPRLATASSSPNPPCPSARLASLKPRSRRSGPMPSSTWPPTAEFLREGSAVDDFLRPDRIVVGSESKRAQETLRKIYQPITAKGAPLISRISNRPSSSNMRRPMAIVAMRLAFINHLADSVRESWRRHRGGGQGHRP